MYAGATELKERVVEERRTKYGKRIVKHVKGKVIIKKVKLKQKKK